ncbi:exonuclease domain-containing protein [Fructilactobacillus ixorae]|uniref:Exonuclease domain-containing protein n=1 Tax=Fructilactobacillus ixorae TaxID=1750535 RepID=A0ABY5C5Y4_9LACO|nr:exonuclease domain-containing protein [Fructilactobacillus ixorae]USS93797.1 exonuclease domain-containing protein [Fructilactobacillus ixorae]
MNDTPMFINLENKNNGKIKQVKIGYSWTTLFFGPIPALIQSFWTWFWIVLVTDIVLFYPTIILGTIIANAIFAAYINKKHVIYLLNKGWQPSDKNSENIIKNSYSLPIRKNIKTKEQKNKQHDDFNPNKENPPEKIDSNINRNKEGIVKPSENEIKDIKLNSSSQKSIQQEETKPNNHSSDQSEKNINEIKRSPSNVKIHRRWKPYYNYMVLDIETTGLNPVDNDIIQISAIRYIDDKPVKTFNHYVQPQNDEISPKIYSLTGISNDDVKSGLSLNDALTELEVFYNSNMKPAIIGHNIDFDITFLTQKGVNISEITIEDTLLMAKQAQKDLSLPNNKLETLKDYFGIKNGSHNSLNDVKTTAIVYQKLRDKGYKPKKITTKKSSENKSNPYGYYMRSKVTKSSAIGQAILEKSNKSAKKLNDLNFAITGNLFELSRDDAKKAIENKGGIFKSGMSSKVNYLVVGVEDKNVVGEDGKSTKMRKAEELIAKGYPIKMINEDQFLELLK